ncbi:hypothetical protein OIU77_015492 [Salix suchowensis]|uniref:Uncharacterized protein n=1 Tax=Salix suchowensis TaxID=1278906 RepID=A0ABQ8ZHK7_9ROSI|nr:hypothetical protein OIU77_015492 [Salix suchowensis]
MVPQLKELSLEEFSTLVCFNRPLSASILHIPMPGKINGAALSHLTGTDEMMSRKHYLAQNISKVHEKNFEDARKRHKLDIREKKTELAKPAGEKEKVKADLQRVVLDEFG